MKKIVKNIFLVLSMLSFIIACSNSGGSDNPIEPDPVATSGMLTVMLCPVNDYQPEGGWSVELIKGTTSSKEATKETQVKFTKVAFGDYTLKVAALDKSGTTLFEVKKEFSMKREIQSLRVDIESAVPSVKFSVVTKLPQEITKVAVNCATNAESKTFSYKNGEYFSYDLNTSGNYTFSFSFQDNAGVEYFKATETVAVENGAKSISLVPVQTKVTPLIFSLPAGSTVAPGDTLTITCNSSVSGIYYTTDGTNPNDKSAVYVNPIAINDNMTVNAIAYLTVDGMLISSDMKTANYTVNNDLLKSPVINGVAEGTLYNSAVTVSIFNPNGEGTVYYTLDGTEPTESSTVYSSAINLSDAKSYTLKAFVKSGSKASKVVTVNFQIQKDSVSAPVFNPASGEIFSNNASITITSNTVGALIYYTTDPGQEPTTLYSGAISLTTNGSHTIKAVAVKGDLKSSVETATYTLNLSKDIVETPVITPASGTFTTAQSVKIECGTSGADIYYTTDG
ncbi:MAG: chitobiase/beta-hexosaminidase C-terminal domain-containing protein, partial [Spirochaetota bacterium]|nr:chitobiase/beta-hexosaminidase C-terminal domain-containing protein [Spirochaetota bacterium]